MGQSICDSLKQEIPNLISSIWERACNLQCQHCIYQFEKTSQEHSKNSQFADVLAHMVKQMPKITDAPRFSQPFLLHEGRILRKWHIGALVKLRNLRKDLQIGLIDNGSYVNLIPEFKKHNLLLDWLDISLDGVRGSHNQQRDPIHKKSFDQTIKG